MLEANPQYEGLNITFNTNEDCNLGCSYCLSGDTLIRMADLTLKPIRDIVEGDYVLGFDENTIDKGYTQRRMVPARVEKLYRRKAATIALDFDNGKTLQITENHEILTPRGNSPYAWRPAGKFKPGQEVHSFGYEHRSTVEGRSVVVSVAPADEIEVFNIGTTTRTYIANDICVHNCYEISKKKKVLPLEYAKRFIDLILTDPDPIDVMGTSNQWILEQGLILDFIGGDALMHPRLVDQIMSYFLFKAHSLNHRWKDRWRISISTNGTLFEREDVRAFVEKWAPTMSLGISIDGSPRLHDLNRKFLDGRGSMETIQKWWPWYLSVFGEAGRHTKSTLNRESIPYLRESLEFMHREMGIAQIYQNFIMEDTGATEADLVLLDEQMGLCVDYVLKNRHTLYWSMLEREDGVQNFAKNCELHPDTGWCGSGAMPALSVDGKIYPCFRFLPHTQASDTDFAVGDVWKGFYRKDRFATVRAQTREKISEPKCRECAIESICAWCIGGSYSEKGEFFRTTYICEINKIRAKWSGIYWERYRALEGPKI